MVSRSRSEKVAENSKREGEISESGRSATDQVNLAEDSDESSEQSSLENPLEDQALVMGQIKICPSATRTLCFEANESNGIDVVV